MLSAAARRQARPDTDGSLAWLDVIQGATGAFLVVFMWAHMFEVSSILLGADAMYATARMFEGEPLFGEPYPLLVSLIAALVLVVFVVHAVVAIRRIPPSYRQYRRFRSHMLRFRHTDTSLWLVQVVTGFVLMFFAAAHLLQMLLNPSDIGPYASADRVWSGRWWPIYLVLLFAVEVHGGVGIYRLAIKWGWFTDRQGRTRRRALGIAAAALVVFFVLLGLTTLGAYMKIGHEHRDRAGERYVPSALTPKDPAGG